jgi:hypothetical protein
MHWRTAMDCVSRTAETWLRLGPGALVPGLKDHVERLEVSHRDVEEAAWAELRMMLVGAGSALYVISEDAFALVKAGAEAMSNESAKLVPPMSRSGVAFFPQPVHSHKNSYVIHALMWEATAAVEEIKRADGIAFSRIDTMSERDFNSKMTTGESWDYYVSYMSMARDLARREVSSDAQVPDVLVPVSSRVFAQRRWADPALVEVSDLLLPSMWAFCRQKLLVPASPFIPRRLAGLYESVVGAKPIVKIIELRTLKRPGCPDGESDIEWTHRWIVRGHWREQWIPSRNAHEPRWIAPYVKGPEDKPLVVADKTVYAVVR